MRFFFSIAFLVVLATIAQAQVNPTNEERARCEEAEVAKGRTLESAKKQHNKCEVTCTYTNGEKEKVNSPPSSKCCPNPSPLSAPTGCCSGDSARCNVGDKSCF